MRNGLSASIRGLACAVAATAALAGCASLQQMQLNGGDAEVIGYAARLIDLEPEERRQAVAEARQRWERTGDPRDRARLGLARGQWGHEGYAPTAAVPDIRHALAADGVRWNETERRFLNLRAAELAYLAEREGDMARLRQERTELETSLQEARRKLRAITDIERSLGEKESEE